MKRSVAIENIINVLRLTGNHYCDNGREIDLENHVLCVNGAVFNKRLSPTLRMLEDVYADRKKNKKIMMGKKEELKRVLDRIQKLESEV
jgi:hypothetical protein